MTRSEITNFLHGEEMVPVVFLRDCPGLGFVVNQDHGSSDIPATYHANVPFWLASIMGSPEIEDKRFLTVQEPPWLKMMGPGATIEVERSYEFAKSVAVACQNETSVALLKGLLKERVPDIVGASLQGRRRQFDRDDKVFLAEEKEMIANSQKAVEQFYTWKTGDNGLKRGSRV